MNTLHHKLSIDHDKSNHKTEERKSSLKPAMEEFMINFHQLSISEGIFERKNGLGTINKVVYKHKIYSGRLIKFDRLSRYDLEGISKDMEEIL